VEAATDADEGELLLAARGACEAAATTSAWRGFWSVSAHRQQCTTAQRACVRTILLAGSRGIDGGNPVPNEVWLWLLERFFRWRFELGQALGPAFDRAAFSPESLGCEAWEVGTSFRGYQAVLDSRLGCEIEVVTLTGMRLPFDIRSMGTVGDLKETIQGTQGIPIDHQRLFFNNAQLEDGRQLVSCGIGLGSVVHLVLRLRGGMFHISTDAAAGTTRADVGPLRMRVVVGGLVNMETARFWGEGHCPRVIAECGDSTFTAMPDDTLGDVRNAVAQLAVEKKKTLPVNFRVAVRPLSLHCFTDAFPELCSMGFGHLAVIAALDDANGGREQALASLLASVDDVVAIEGGGGGAVEAVDAHVDAPLEATLAEVIAMLRERFPNPTGLALEGAGYVGGELRGSVPQLWGEEGGPAYSGAGLGLFILSEDGSMTYGLPA
jgi:ubiquitin-like protein Nedd8